MTAKEKVPVNLGLNEVMQKSQEPPKLGWDPFRMEIPVANMTFEEVMQLKRNREWNDSMNPDHYNRMDINDPDDYLPLSHFFPKNDDSRRV